MRLFAALRELAGLAAGGRLEVATADAPDVRSLLDHLAARFGPEFSRIAAAGTVVVEGEIAGPERSLAAGVEVALLPPVSGGST